MPVTKSAKKALRTATRRHEENLVQREAYKRALKDVRKVAVPGAGEVPAALISTAQSLLDRAAKNNTIHPNKAARLKSRMSKRIATAAAAPAPEVKPKKVAASKTAPKKAAAKKPAAK